MIDRKELKRKGRQILKAHYAILIIACLLSGLIATEFSDTFTLLSTQNESYSQKTSSPSSKLNTTEVFKDILNDDLSEGEKDAEAITEETIKEDHSAILGRSRGVLASIINSFTSGSIYVSTIAAINSMVGSESLAIFILIVFVLLLVFAVWFYIQNTFAVIIRRIFLEARTYHKVPFERYMFLSHVKRWTKAAFVMFVSFVYQSLWALTIVGIFIKHYAYFMVPYIIAENPDISANRAITLSRKMMDGHKWECFKIDVTFLGWTVLSSLTFGFSAIFYSNPYKMCTFSEYYAKIRAEAIEKKIDDYELLNDVYLFEKPTRKVLKEVYPEIKDRHIEAPILKGIEGFLVNFFGLFLKEGPKEKEYERKMRLIHRYEAIEEVVSGNQYPRRLFTIEEEDKSKLFASLDPLRDYSIYSVILMFFIFSMIGWIWEVSLHIIAEGVFVNRGALHVLSPNRCRKPARWRAAACQEISMEFF